MGVRGPIGSIHRSVLTNPCLTTRTHKNAPRILQQHPDRPRVPRLARQVQRGHAPRPGQGGVEGWPLPVLEEEGQDVGFSTPGGEVEGGPVFPALARQMEVGVVEQEDVHGAGIPRADGGGQVLWFGLFLVC